MALFENSSNPAMGSGIYSKARQLAGSNSGVMTVQGTVVKTLLLLLMLTVAGAFTWQMVTSGNNPSAPTGWIIGGLIGGLICALVIIFKPNTAPYLAPFYAAAEGLFLGAISAIFNVAFAETMPGIVVTAVSLTVLTTFIMLFAYQTKLIKVTEKFRSVIIIATASVAVFYLIVLLLGVFGVETSFIHGSSWLSIGISIVIVGIAALNLLLDFDFIEKGASAGAPKFMEWYGAFGLLVTLVWLYLEILKLLAKFAGRN